MTDRAIQIFPL